MKKILFIISWGVSIQGGMSQKLSHIRFTNYTTADGLGSSNIRKTIQDSKGFIWTIAQDGVYRFNGRKFDVYNKDKPKQYALTGSVIADLTVNNNTLWAISMFGAIDGIDINTGRVIYSNIQPKSATDKDLQFQTLGTQGDTLFIGSNKGLFIFNSLKKNPPPQKIVTPNEQLNTANITRLTLDKANHLLWLFCFQQGVYVLDNRTLTLLSFYPDATNYVYDCDIEKNESVFAATSGGIRKYMWNGKNIVCNAKPFPEIKASQAEDIYAIKQYRNKLFFSNKNNLISVDTLSGNYEYIKESRFGIQQNLTAAVFGIFFDKDDHLWLSGQRGLAYSNNQPAALVSFSKSSVSSDVINHAYGLFCMNDSIVYVSGEGGFYRVNTFSGAIKTLDRNKRHVVSFLDFNKRLWALNDEGPFVYENNKLTPVSNIYPEFRHWNNLFFNSAVAIGDSVYLFGSQNKRGLFIWNRNKKTVSNITDTGKSMRLEENAINNLYTDKSGIVWILADHSIMLYDPARQTIQTIKIFHPQRKEMYSLFFDAVEIKKEFYITSYDHGVIVLDKNHRFVKEISVTQGLSNNGTYRLLSYRDSLLLITTNNGLGVLNLTGGHIQNYFKEDGLHTNEFEEFSSAAYQNVLYAGGTDGFTKIRPEFFSTNTKPPLLYWNRIAIHTPSENIDTSHLYFTNVSIPNNVLETTVSFSALNYNNPARTVFAYKIKELQKEWINIDHRDFINLIGLNPGKYTLQVKAANEDGVWNEQPIELVLTFLPKWFQTWWFKILVVLVVAVLLYILYRYRLQQVIKVERVRQKISSDLHDDIGSTLSSVNLFTKMAIMQPEKKEYLPYIDQGIQNAITGVRDIIWILDKHPETVESIFNRIVSFSVTLSKAAGSDFEVNINDELKEYSLSGEEKRNTYLVLKEAINNSIKYSGCTLITLTAIRKGGQIVMAVHDNGKGLVKDAAGNISVSETGGGNGLKNMRLRCEEIKWKLEITGETGVGTTIYLSGKLRE